MIAVTYQLFFYDPSQNRENQLIAIQPLFKSPSAIKILLKVAKFENKQSLIYSGREEDIEDLLKQVARLDTTEWLDYDFEKLAASMDEIANTLGISRFNFEGIDDEQVLGDPPDLEENKVLVEAKKNNYPIDIPEKNYWLWDDIKKNYRSEIKKRAGKDLDKKEAVHRILYTNSALKLGLIPFSFVTVTKTNDARDELCHYIMEGEDKASDLIETWERHLKDDGTLKKTKCMKYLGSSFEEKASRYYIAHAIEWILGVEWKILSDYLKKNHGFKIISKDHIALTINRITKLEVILENTNTVAIYVSHILTPHQASILTNKTDKDSIVKMLHKYSTIWYKSGHFPDVKKIN